MENNSKRLLDSLAGPLRIGLLTAFLLVAKAGWFTWLTPETVHIRVNQIMDFLVLAVPVAYMAWAFFQDYRKRGPEAIVDLIKRLSDYEAAKVAPSLPPVVLADAAAALPEVKAIVATPQLAADTASNKVVAS